jgi:hypothetical protein
MEAEFKLGEEGSGEGEKPKGERGAVKMILMTDERPARGHRVGTGPHNLAWPALASAARAAGERRKPAGGARGGVALGMFRAADTGTGNWEPPRPRGNFKLSPGGGAGGVGCH